MKLNNNRTSQVYSFLWKEVDKRRGCFVAHFIKMQEAIPEQIVSGELGLEIGCGDGLDTQIMASKSSNTKIIAIDISEGVYSADFRNRYLDNVRILRSSALKLPFKSGIFDFCYSFGVIHHTADPSGCFKEIFRVLRLGGKTFLYLYEDHSDNILKKYPLIAVSVIRKITSHLDNRVLYSFCLLASPFVFVVFSLPARIFNRFRATKKLAEAMPFNFGRAPFSLAGDLYDRFGAPIELRFNSARLHELLEKGGFSSIIITKLKATAGLVVQAVKA